MSKPGNQAQNESSGGVNRISEYIRNTIGNAVRDGRLEEDKRGSLAIDNLNGKQTNSGV